MNTRRKRNGHRWGFVWRGGRTNGRADGDRVRCSRWAELLAGRLTLQRAPAGEELRVTYLHEESGHAQRLRELGMFEGQRVRVLTGGNPLICQVGDCRFGICKRLAGCIAVEPVAAASSAQSA